MWLLTIYTAFFSSIIFLYFPQCFTSEANRNWMITPKCARWTGKSLFKQSSLVLIPPGLWQIKRLVNMLADKRMMQNLGLVLGIASINSTEKGKNYSWSQSGIPIRNTKKIDHPFLKHIHEQLRHEYRDWLLLMYILKGQLWPLKNFTPELVKEYAENLGRLWIALPYWK